MAFLTVTPSKGHVTIALPNDLANATLIVTNPSGAIIERRAAVGSMRGQTLQLNFPSNQWFVPVRIVSNGQTFTQKILIQK